VLAYKNVNAASSNCCAWVDERALTALTKPYELCELNIETNAHDPCHSTPCNKNCGCNQLSDCASPNKPNGPAADAIVSYAADEAKWRADFQAVWVKATEVGRSSLKAMTVVPIPTPTPFPVPTPTPTPTPTPISPETLYEKVADSTVTYLELQCNGGDKSTMYQSAFPSTLKYTELAECADMCDRCDGCTGFVDVRDAAVLYCAFKSAETTLQAKAGKDFYRRKYFYGKVLNTANSGAGLKCSNVGCEGGAWNWPCDTMSTQDLAVCETACNECNVDGTACVGFVYANGVCAFKSTQKVKQLSALDGSTYYKKPSTTALIQADETDTQTWIEIGQ